MNKHISKIRRVLLALAYTKDISGNLTRKQRRIIVGNTIKIPSGTNVAEQLTLCNYLASLDIDGCVVECGTYHGSCAASLSLICKQDNRRLHVFDTFSGLPEMNNMANTSMTAMETHRYITGDWSGDLQEVRCNIHKRGHLDVCDFHVGLFGDTMTYFDEACAFAFIDADLRESVIDCLTYLWPLIVDGGIIFTHEATHREIVNLFYDRDWWRDVHGEEPPGLIGAGSGLGLIPMKDHWGSGLAYTVKGWQRLQREDKLLTTRGSGLKSLWGKV